ncbi:NTTRR-F1 domain [Brevibacillus laterosporus]|uniref:NTTRR-F1 domain n=1 Tax=Brevibacillus laterosporus TaxID=1465 RepID=UPI000839C56A|nr:NTTRR-F1 domain [Brevibacillus laterosporus]
MRYYFYDINLILYNLLHNFCASSDNKNLFHSKYVFLSDGTCPFKNRKSPYNAIAPIIFIMKVVIYMSFINRIVNGDFETGTLTPWGSSNVSITNLHSHTGNFSAQLLGGTTSSLLTQLVPVVPGESFEFFLSIAKTGGLPSPQVDITIIYLNIVALPVSIGLSTTIPFDHLPDNTNNKNWTTIYETTSIVPLTAIDAVVLINNVPSPATADIVVDSIALLQTS